ncbi:MAG: peptidoglycan DD-metalloendopeptidase family protein [Nitrospirota bacterium]
MIGAATAAGVKTATLFFLFFFILSFLPEPCRAASTHEEYKKIQKEIDAHQRKLEHARKRESSVLTDIEGTNRQLKSAETELIKYKNRLADTEGKMSRIESEIAVNRANLENQKEWIKRKLRAIYRHGQNTDTLMLLLHADDITQLSRNAKYLQYIAVREHKLLDDYKTNIDELNRKERQLASLRTELVRNRERVKAEEKTLEERKRSKEIVLASVKKEEASYKKMLRELKEASDKLLEIIRESERAEQAEKAETAFSGRGLSGLKGKLPWPVDGKVVVPYGSQRDPQFNTPIFRSGAYIQSGSDAAAKAVHGGKVVFAEWFKGYGQLVIINHGDGYHTLYGSLSEIFTKVGDIIKGKQTIGRVGNSGIVSSPGVYFELRYKGKPLDPVQWLRRR